MVSGLETLTAIENIDVDDNKRPVSEVRIEEIIILIDPFEEFLKSKTERDEREKVEEEIRKAGGREDDRTTWTGKRVKRDGVVEGGSEGAVGVGKYLGRNGDGKGEVLEEWEREGEEPVKKKMRGGGGRFGNFDGW